MKKFLVSLTLLVAVIFTAKAENYRLNQAMVDNAFEQSEFVDLGTILSSQENFNAAISEAEDEKQMIAGIVALASFLVRFGSLPISFFPIIGGVIYTSIAVATIIPWHRLVVLGTGGEEIKITALYCVTLGWCINAHHVLDGIFLLTEEDNTRFVDNPRYVMWAN